MLSVLRVRQLAVIDELEVEFGPGLNVVTGETGAGKSILVNALKLVLGARGRPELVRSGADRAEVEALFEGPGIDDQLIIRRLLDANGRTRAYINGRLATLGEVHTLAERMVDICSQHEHQTLANPTTHLGWLDAFAGLNAERQAMAEAWGVLQKTGEALANLERDLRERQRKEELLRAQIDEIEEVSPDPGEDVTLAEEHARLKHAEQLGKGTREARDMLMTSDGAICEALGRLEGRLAELTRIDAALQPQLDQLMEAKGNLEDVARALGRYSRTVTARPERLAEVEERLSELRRLIRKYGATVDDVLGHRLNAMRELDALAHGEERLVELRKEQEIAFGRAAEQARALSVRRRAQAARLGTSITSELRSLGMGEAQVQVDIADLDGRNTPWRVGEAQLSEEGLDRAEFLIATNMGEQPRPLRKVASGGELSRALLALKKVLAGLGGQGLSVFDEVDTGVGGGIAEVIGRKLYEVSRLHQVLCITHQPQIAIYGDQHFHVRKRVAEGRTRSMIHLLDPSERLEEVARMLGGIDITDTTRQAAAELLRQAHEARA